MKIRFLLLLLSGTIINNAYAELVFSDDSKSGTITTFEEAMKQNTQIIIPQIPYTNKKNNNIILNNIKPINSSKENIYNLNLQKNTTNKTEYNKNIIEFDPIISNMKNNKSSKKQISNQKDNLNNHDIIKKLNDSVNIPIVPIEKEQNQSTSSLSKDEEKKANEIKNNEVLLLPTDLNEKIKRLMTELDPKIYGYWIDTKEYNKELMKKAKEEQAKKAIEPKEEINIEKNIKKENVEHYKSAKEYINDFFGDGEVDGTAQLNNEEKERVVEYLSKLKIEADKLKSSQKEQDTSKIIKKDKISNKNTVSTINNKDIKTKEKSKKLPENKNIKQSEDKTKLQNIKILKENKNTKL